MNPENADPSSELAFYLADHSSIEELKAVAALLASEETVDRTLDLRLGVALLCFKMTVGGASAFFLKTKTEVPYAVVQDTATPHAAADLGPDPIIYHAPGEVWLAVNSDVALYTASVDAAFELAEACGEDPEVVLTEAIKVELKAPAAVFTSDFARRFLISLLSRLIFRAGLAESDLDSP